MKKTLANTLVAASALVASAWLAPAGATTFSGCLDASCTLSASADFVNVGGTLTITLTNTSTADAMILDDLLTAVLWTSGTVFSTASSTAVLAAGALVYNDNDPVANGQPAGGNVGGEWAYKSGLVGAPNSTNQGISSVGGGSSIFGSATFNGPDLDDPAALNGDNYGITSAGDVTSTGTSVNNVPYIQNAVVFTLLGVGSFDPATIANLWFRYGSEFTGHPGFRGCITGGVCSSDATPQVPLPAALPLLLGGLGWSDLVGPD